MDKQGCIHNVKRISPSLLFFLTAAVRSFLISIFSSGENTWNFGDYENGTEWYTASQSETGAS